MSMYNVKAMRVCMDLHVYARGPRKKLHLVARQRTRLIREHMRYLNLPLSNTVIIFE